MSFLSNFPDLLARVQRFAGVSLHRRLPARALGASSANRAFFLGLSSELLCDRRGAASSRTAIRRLPTAAILAWLCLASIAGLSACATTAPVPEKSFALPYSVGTVAEVNGDLDQLSATRFPSDSYAPAPEQIAMAIARAQAASNSESNEFQDPQLSEYGANEETDAWEETWLRLDEATNLGRIAIAPSPEPQPVDVATRQAAMTRKIPPGELHIYVAATRERYKVRVYDNSGRMRLDAVRELSWALRDRRIDRARSLNPRLISMLYLVGQYYDAELEVVSGYRLRGVNASEGSRHGAAAACDFRIPGVSTRSLAEQADRMFARTGVGYYPNSGFVHLDDRDTAYAWTDSSRPGRRPRMRSRSVSTRPPASDDPTLQSIHMPESLIYQLPPSERDVGYDD